MKRIWYRNPENPIDLFCRTWDMAETRWIDEIDMAKDWARQRLDMSWMDFLDKLSRSRRALFRFIEEDTYIGGRFFTAFVRFDDPDHQRELFGWAYVPVEMAELLTGALEIWKHNI